MSRAKVKCKKCEYGRPRCEKGKRIHKEMTEKYLQNGLKVTEDHLKRWEKWINHTQE